MNQLTLPQQVTQMDAERLRTYRENLDFYNGTQWQGRARPRERRLTINYVKTLVGKLTSYLMTGMTTVIEPGDARPESAEMARRAQDALQRVNEENYLDALDFDTELDTSILGDGCYKVTWDPQEERVRVSAPDVQGIFAWWLGDDPSRVWRIASRYRLTLEEAAILYGVQASGTREVSVLEAWTDEAFQLWVEDTLVQERANPYGFIPFVVFPNLRVPKAFWGESDVPPLMEPARELNRALSQLAMIIELSGNPIAVLEGVERAEDIAVQPGAVWELPEKARAYLLDLLQGGGVKLHVDFIELIYRTIYDLSEAPKTSFGDNPRALSGIALEMEMHPLLQRVRRKRLTRTAAYKRRNDMVLRVLEQRTGERYLPVRQRIVWGPVLPQDRGRLAREEQLLVEAGLHSRRRAMETLGIDNPDAELRQVREEG